MWDHLARVRQVRDPLLVSTIRLDFLDLILLHPQQNSEHISPPDHLNEAAMSFLTTVLLELTRYCNFATGKGFQVHQQIDRAIWMAGVEARAVLLLEGFSQRMLLSAL